jgi:hypothetical protein
MLRWLHRMHGNGAVPQGDERLEEAQRAAAMADRTLTAVRRRGPALEAIAAHVVKLDEPNHFRERVVAMLRGELPEGRHG